MSKKKELEIRKILELDPAVLEQDTKSLLDRDPEENCLGLTVYPFDGGWWVYTGNLVTRNGQLYNRSQSDWEAAALPKDLDRCIRTSIMLDRQWILFRKNAAAKILDLSTAHIRYYTSLALGSKDQGNTCSLPLVVHEYPYGWNIYTGCFCFKDGHVCFAGSNISAGLPKDLEGCIRLALEHGCQWLQLDMDGPKTEGLPSYDW